MDQPTSSVGKTLRKASHIGPCLQLGTVVKETEKTFTYHNKMKRREVRANKVTLMTPYAEIHTDPCKLCTDHPQTQYPRGHED